MTLSPSMVVSIQAALLDPDRPSYEQIAKFHGCSPRKVADIAAGAEPAGGASEKGMTLSPSMVVSIQAALLDPDRPSYEQIAKFHGCSPRKVADIAAGAEPAGGASEKMEAIVAMNTEGLTNYAIAKRTGKTKQAIGQMLARAETLGFTIKDNRRYPLGKG